MLVLMLVPSALGKLRDWQAFVEGVVAYQVLPSQLARLFGWALPIIELLLAIGLLWTPTVVVSSLGLIGLLFAFMIAISSNLRRGRRMACFCAGAQHTHPISWGMVGRNLLLIGLCLLLIMLPMAGSIAAWSMSEALMVAILVLALWLLVQLAEQSVNRSMKYEI